MEISSQPGTDITIGILGLGLLSRNLILAVARRGYPVVGFDSDPGRIAELRKQAQGLPVALCGAIEEFTGQLRPPRVILILVQGGPHLNETLRALGEHLDGGDIMIDGTSYHHLITPRRRKFFAGHGVHFLAAGIASSGQGHEYGCHALYPELLETCRRIRPLFEIAATTAPGEPCVTFVGRQIEQQLRRLITADPALSSPERGDHRSFSPEDQREDHRSDRGDCLRQEYCGATS